MRDGSLIPQVPIAQSTSQIDWSKLTWKAFKVDTPLCTGYLYKPGSTEIEVVKR